MLKDEEEVGIFRFVLVLGLMFGILVFCIIVVVIVVVLFCRSE